MAIVDRFPANVQASALEVTDLRAAYESQVALHGVSMSVPAGSSVAVLGTNGAGKTTLMNAIAGLHRPIKGTVTLGQTPIGRLTAHRIADMGICYVPEGRGVFPDLTVAENLRVSIGRSPEKEERFFETFPPIKACAHRPAGTLSGGEQQMVAMAPAVVGGYGLLIVDEMSLGLAPIVVDRLFQLLAQIRSSGVSIIIVEQFAERALALTDRAYVVRKGHIVFEGPSQQLRDDPGRLQTLYMGEGS